MKLQWQCTHKKDHWTWSLYVNNEGIALTDLRKLGWVWHLWTKLNPDYDPNAY